MNALSEALHDPLNIPDSRGLNLFSVTLVLPRCSRFTCPAISTTTGFPSGSS